MEKLNTYFSTKQVANVLDVGTGPGAFISVLKDAFPKAKITGVDPNSESLKEASTSFPDVEFKKMVGENLAFSDNSFDVASISMALHHLPNVEQTLRQMQRVVKSGGWIVVNELFSDNLNAAQEVHKSMHHFRSKIDRLLGVCHNQTFTRHEILEQIKKSGLQIEFDFTNDKALKQPDKKEIAERELKLTDMIEQIHDRPEYEIFKKEIPEIISRLKTHGFQMASCAVVVAKVIK